MSENKIIQFKTRPKFGAKKQTDLLDYEYLRLIETKNYSVTIHKRCGKKTFVAMLNVKVPKVSKMFSDLRVHNCLSKGAGGSPRAAVNRAVDHARKMLAFLDTVNTKRDPDIARRREKPRSYKPFELY